MNFKETLHSILKESVDLKTPVPDIGNITYATSLSFNDDNKNIVKMFVDYVSQYLKLKNVPSISLLAERIHGITTGAYIPKENKIYAVAMSRALPDILRTIAHELVHHYQRETGKFDMSKPVQDAGGPIEDEANAKAGELLKRFVKDKKMDMIYSV